MTGELQIFVAPIMAVCISTALLLALLRFPDLLVDHPNQRSLHQTPVPRTGGIAIVASGLTTTALILPEFMSFAFCALLIALVSLVDDWRQLHPLPRFGAQGLISVAFCVIGLGQISAAETVFLVVTMVWLANLYNFMDGSDGLAGGMTVIGFGSCAIGAWIGGGAPLATVCATVVAASLPFLVLNFHPARIFMGDVGAVTLGFSAAAIGSIGWREGIWSPFFPVFAFSPFIADASLTLLRRMLNREQFWCPHREHYYQKLVRMGLGHRNTALVEYAVMVISGAGAVSTFYMGGIAQLIAIVAWGTLLILAAETIDRRWLAFQDSAR